MRNIHAIGNMDPTKHPQHKGPLPDHASLTCKPSLMSWKLSACSLNLKMGKLNLKMGKLNLKMLNLKTPLSVCVWSLLTPRSLSKIPGVDLDLSLRSGMLAATANHNHHKCLVWSPFSAPLWVGPILSYSTCLRPLYRFHSRSIL